MYERDTGARGFGFTGGHFHHSWLHDHYRRLVLNAILWTAGRQVPSGGVPSEKPLVVRHKSMLQAIAKGDTADIGRHLALGTEVNAQNTSGWAPLHYAVVRGRTDTARLLVDGGADVDLRTNSGRTPLHEAAARGFMELVELLVQRGAELAVRDKDGWTPLHFAAAKDRAAIAGYLLDQGAPVNALSTRGGTPLHEAAASGGRELLTLLLARGADPGIKAANGKTAFDYAVELGNEDAADTLRSRAQGEPSPAAEDGANAPRAPRPPESTSRRVQTTSMAVVTALSACAVSPRRAGGPGYAGGGTRTPTLLPAADFESAASAIPPLRRG